ncbi:MAG: hypothetical protein A2289_15645 [Deltaproteobacteria bacterium RIFOXYA12_FULL_58_15]|nr:MAG: hypothetical protein A2289_15645 [Deltaproteobacteria bacterium RIFOXYA12_FULL_58_15]
MVANGQAIANALGWLRSALWRMTFVNLTVAYVAVLGFACGLGVLFAQWGYASVGLGAIITMASAAAIAAIWLIRQRVPADAGRLEQARLAESLAPELGTAATSAVTLSDDVVDGGRFSADLIDLHLKQTRAALDGVDFPGRLEHRHHRARRNLRWLLAACMTWAIAMLLICDAGRARLAALVLDAGAAQTSDIPLAGDIRLTYRYPAYTQLPPRVVEGGDGSMTAVAGTEVLLTATADHKVEEALLRVTDMSGEPMQSVPMTVDGQVLATRLSILRDSRYHFELVQDGDRIVEKMSRPIRAALDEHPEVHLDAPASDLILKDDQNVDILWRAKDDFGVAEVNLVVERLGQANPQKIPLATSEQTGQRREDRYRWSLSDINLAPGNDVRFFLEAFDNDTISGPKRAVSATRTLSVFSASKHHLELLERQRQLLERLVDWLAAELVAPFSKTGGDQAIATQRSLVATMDQVASDFAVLIIDLREDKLTGDEIIAAFSNVGDHVDSTRNQRSRDLTRVSAPLAKSADFNRMFAHQMEQIALLENDIIYLDDLLALQRIDELKRTAKELLSAQRNLAELLQQYKDTQDPALRAALDQQIRDLRSRMMELLQKMASIKQSLPGEYRNLEAAAMNELGDQLDRLEDMLREGNLEAAAAELEQLANMVENMMNSIDRAQQELGTERYAELRAELAEFGKEFRELEGQQKALADRAEKLAQEYRQAAVDRAGKNLDAFVSRARKKAARALEALDEVANAPEIFPHTQEEMAHARERLLDTDALLENRDFAQAQSMAEQAQARAETVESLIDRQMQYNSDNIRRNLSKANRASREAKKHTRELNDMLKKLFPPANEVMSQNQREQMQRMAKKQRSLERQAEQLGKKMDGLSEQLPLFGGEPRASLDSAQSEMGQGANAMQAGELPGASQHKRRAADELGKLREALEKASQGQQGGMPLPLGMGGGQGRPGRGNDGQHSEPVEIPQADKNRADPQFRKDLLEAAKQKAPDRYEGAVRKYYEELIR